MSVVLPVVLSCPPRVAKRAGYVLDTFAMAVGLRLRFQDARPGDGPWLFYGERPPVGEGRNRCLALACSGSAWSFLDGRDDVRRPGLIEGLPVALGEAPVASGEGWDIGFDLFANAFYFLSSWSERRGQGQTSGRQMFRDSAFARLGMPQDIVDRYLSFWWEKLKIATGDAFSERGLTWPDNRDYAVVLSHDVDFIPVGLGDTLKQGGKTLLRHLLRERKPGDALRAAFGLAAALASGRDAYGCLPEIIQQECRLGVRSSFQVAVARRHPNDVNYDVDDPRTRDYLGIVTRSGFDLCLHGSYLSTDEAATYQQEAEKLRSSFGAVAGSRQHFLSFDYDRLFAAQEASGIQYDMSLGYPDCAGPRAGFSYPFFPYNLDADRPFNVVQIPLFLMDVTLRVYMGLRGEAAREAVWAELDALRSKGGGVSVVWHPIVFGEARDPGMSQLYWDMVQYVLETRGLATDGRAVNSFWREKAVGYRSFVRCRA